MAESDTRVTLNVRVKVELAEKIQDAADHQNRTRSNWLETLAERELANPHHMRNGPPK